MKYGESSFIVVYLLFAVISGIILLIRDKKLMGIATLVLGCGDAFHLIPRIMQHFIRRDITDLSAPLGIGKLVTSITMTVFYLLLHRLWTRFFTVSEDYNVTVLVRVLVVLRIALCLFPQNGWITNDSSVTWAVIRNVPFVILGAVIFILYYRKRDLIPHMRHVWLYILLSFLFYIPVAVGAGMVPMLGMLMIPKTVCYMLMIVSFLRFSKGND
ncbi:MAG: hypothetical protein II672_05400 [Oscillospiraceae bacterium]|nr:hypothetical protein [Oscillospiraceae bacterium]